MKKALVTGATGFVGSSLVRRLLKAGWQVDVIVRPSSSMKMLSELDKQIGLLRFDGETSDLLNLVADSKPDIVFHLASLFLVDHKPDQVKAIIESNVLFGTQLLEAMTAEGVMNFVNTSSYWTHYQGQEYLPANLYAASKQAYCDIIEYYVDAKGMCAVTLELYDTYGQDDPRPKVLNLLNRIAKNGESLRMSPGMQKLDLVHVDDVAEAYLKAGECLLDDKWSGHKKFAIRSDNPITLRELVSIIETETGQHLSIEWGERPYRAREVMEPYSIQPALPDWHAHHSVRTLIAEWSNNN